MIFWLTGHDGNSLNAALTGALSVEEFFSSFLKLNYNAVLITGTICGRKIQEISDSLEKNIRYLDKLVDELAKGKKLNKVLRKGVRNGVSQNQ